MNAKLHTYSAKKFNNLLSSISRLLYYILHATAAINYFLCNTFFSYDHISYLYISSIHALDRSPPAHRPYLVLQLECISNGIKGFLPSGCHFAASAARFICTKGFHPCQIPPGPTRKQCIDEQLTPFSTSQCKLTVRFQQQRLHGIFHLTYTVSAHSVICIFV